MRKIVACSLGFIIVMICTTGCDVFDDINSVKDNVSCTTTKQYLDKSGYAYYVEGTCVNNSSSDYDYLQVEYICYDKDGNNLGTALDNTNNLLGNQSWKFKAMFLGSEGKKVKNCDYHEVTGW